jgi:isocitrate dehydrogenase
MWDDLKGINTEKQVISPMSNKTAITVAYGDGIGPEIMKATLDIIQAAGAQLEIEEIVIGLKAYQSGYDAGIAPESWESLRRTKVFLKAPITTPQGGGFKSLNVTTRKMLGLFANVRPCISYHPYVDTKHPKMDMVIVRENEEDLYAGIEHQQTDEVVQCLKLISRPGCEKIVRYAFEYARQYGRKKVTCFTKDNIMKQTDGLFHAVFDEIGAEYPDIERDHWIIDIGSAKMADTPEDFDVIVTLNLYGDIISDIAAQIAGSVGLAGSANIGANCAMFEAIHGSAPRRADQNVANPSGLLLGAVQMLVHINQNEVAAKVHNAWLKTLEDGYHTYDIYKKGLSVDMTGKSAFSQDTLHGNEEKGIPSLIKRGVEGALGTQEFAQAVIERLGQKPVKFTPVEYKAVDSHVKHGVYVRKPAAKKDLVGVDMMVHWRGDNAAELAEKVKALNVPNIDLKFVSNRGIIVWPTGFPETFLSDHWRCRFFSNGAEHTPISHKDISNLLAAAGDAGIDFIKTENLCRFDGKDAFSKGQGQ